MARPAEWDDPPGYDRKLGRMRHHTDDFLDHRKLVSERITAALECERQMRRHRQATRTPSRIGR